jgi:hypothetical protein
MSSVTASTSCYFVRNKPELPSSTLLLPTALFFRKLHDITISTYLLHVLTALHHLPDRSNFGKMHPLSWPRQAADSSFKFSEMQIHIPDLLECLSLLKDYNQHLINSLHPLFFLPQSGSSWRLPLLCV